MDKYIAECIIQKVNEKVGYETGLYAPCKDASNPNWTPLVMNKGMESIVLEIDVDTEKRLIILKLDYVDFHTSNQDFITKDCTSLEQVVEFLSLAYMQAAELITLVFKE